MLDKVLPKIKEYFEEQEQLCFEQTGECLSADDIVGHLDSDEFKEQFGELSFEELFSYLVSQ